MEGISFGVLDEDLVTCNIQQKGDLAFNFPNYTASANV